MLFAVKAVIDTNLNSVSYLSYFIGLLSNPLPQNTIVEQGI
jgi:hypothetical protein